MCYNIREVMGFTEHFATFCLISKGLHISDLRKITTNYTSRKTNYTDKNSYNITLIILILC